MKYVFAVLVLIVLVFGITANLLWRQLRRKLAAMLQMQAPTQAQTSAARQAQSMVACQQCGLHVPQHEAVYRAGQPYCCQAHANGAAI